ncbi:MAG TPA: transglutaminase domain-containing protein [Chitinispirillaceae bacterium]|nr:transglutaminase domain-containing protein [Chitinispirillaceae bacterium]
MYVRIGTGLKMKIVPLFFCLLIVASSAIVEASSQDGWKLLFENQPVKAAEEFKKIISSASGRDAASAYRGLATVEMFLGKYDTILDYVLSAYAQDKDIILASSRPDALIIDRISADRKRARSSSESIKGLAESAGLFNGVFQELQLRHSQNFESVKNTVKICKKMGVVSKWKYIGPFENISGCGFANVYPPEQEIKFKKEYKGKDGNCVIWHDLVTSDATGWIFLDNYVNEYNAMYYLTNAVVSDAEREVYLSFGASGTFKVFLNGEVVLQDSVFRNTGIDTYMSKVTLNKGINRILVKIGHEGKGSNVGLSGKANFLLRFLDRQYKPVTCLSTDLATEASGNGNGLSENGSSTPVLDSLSHYLLTRLEKDSTDYDALAALIASYNIYDMTNMSQRVIQKYLKMFPNSSLLYSSLYESLIRAKKYTEASVAIKKAYDLCPLNMAAWSNQLAGLKSNGNRRSIETFLDSTPDIFKNEPVCRLARLAIAADMNNSSEVMKIINDLENNNDGNGEIISTLMSIYISQGMFDKAEKIVTEQIKRKKNDASLYNQLAALKLKRGNRNGALMEYRKAISIDPLDPDLYFLIASFLYQDQKYTEALGYTEQCLRILPTSSSALNLKGNILSSMGRTDEAVATFQNTIKFTKDDFTAWDNIFKLKKKKSFEEMTPLQSVDSIIKKSGDWVKSQFDQASIVHYCEDIYLYPSDASRSRVFMVVYLPTQQSIDDWKEYRVEYNGNYQLLSIDRAFSKKADGTEVEADKDENYVVFKSLEPRDYIVLEYSLNDYYQGAMAGKMYGTQLFGTGVPEFESMIRMITPLEDTIPYTISDSTIIVSTRNDGEFKTTVIKAPSSGSSMYESYAPVYHSSYPAVVYSRFSSWKEIADWYYELSKLKQKPTIELTEVVDSITKGVSGDWKKVEKIHEFMSRTINYSFVPFRQSAWIPQSAGDVLSTRIGDCKDMASLGKALCDIAGIESWLVLVNTGVHNFTGYAYKGPNFDHCILAYVIDGKTWFADFTDRNTALGKLPMGDQGAMALVIKPGNDQLITLPIDDSSGRKIYRTIKLELDSSGDMHEMAEAKRTGIFASSLKSLYRFSTYEEKKKVFHRSIADEYPGAVVDSLCFTNLDSLYDSLNYFYNISIKNAVDVSGKNVVFEIKIPDAMTTDYYPVDQDRKKPVDMTFSAFGITEQNTVVECTYPEKWKLMSVPDDITHSTAGIQYSLKFEKKGNKLVCKRNFTSNLKNVMSVKDYQTELDALKKITRSDAIKVIFTK